MKDRDQSMDGAAALRLENAVFRYPDGTPALAGVDLELRCGERVGLVGPNGAGKSTLLLHLNGVLGDGAGLSVCGEPFTRRSAAALRRRVGLVFQDPDDQLFLPTVRDDVAFGLLTAGTPGDETARRVDDALATFGLSELAERPPHRLSVGQKRAVALATVMVLEPEVVVLDEPSANLDPRGKRTLICWLESLACACLVASHDLEFVRAVASRVLLLDGGRIVADGPTDAILADAALMDAHGLEVPHSLRTAQGS